MPKSTAAATAPRAKRTRKTADSSRRRRAITREQIALRAYELHLAGAEGDPVEHWLRAERELVGT